MSCMTLQLFRKQINFIKSNCHMLKLNSSSSLRNFNTSASHWVYAPHKPNTLEKYLLVWMKNYPSVAEVPKTVSPTVMEKVRNKARIKISIYIMVLSAFGFVYMAYSGKQAAKRGESVAKMHMKWLKEQHSKE